MKSQMPSRSQFARPSSRRCFTLAELMVVIAIMGLLGSLTMVAYRGISKNAKLSSGTNTVMAVLDQARGLAIRNNKIVLVAFRPRLDGKNQYIEALLCEWTGESGVACVTPGNGQSPCATGQSPNVVDRFRPIAGMAARRLPAGIKVAGPWYSKGQGSSETPVNGVPVNLDYLWITQSHLPTITTNPATTEAAGEIICVMYAADGTTITRNSRTDSARIFIDFNNDGIQQVLGTQLNYANLPVVQSNLFDGGGSGAGHSVGGYFQHLSENEEPFVDVVAYVAVFDDDLMRELYPPSAWVGGGTGPAEKRVEHYSQFISQNADRIHFNRYSGVAMR